MGDNKVSFMLAMMEDIQANIKSDKPDMEDLKKKLEILYRQMIFLEGLFDVGTCRCENADRREQ